MRAFATFAVLAVSFVLAAPTPEVENGLKLRDDTVDMPTACKIYKLDGYFQGANNQIRPIVSDSTITSEEKASKVGPIVDTLNNKIQATLLICDDTVDNSREAVVSKASSLNGAVEDLTGSGLPGTGANAGGQRRRQHGGAFGGAGGAGSAGAGDVGAKGAAGGVGGLGFGARANPEVGAPAGGNAGLLGGLLGGLPLVGGLLNPVTNLLGNLPLVGGLLNGLL